MTTCAELALNPLVQDIFNVLDNQRPLTSDKDFYNAAKDAMKLVTAEIASTNKEDVLPSTVLDDHIQVINTTLVKEPDPLGFISSFDKLKAFVLKNKGEGAILTEQEEGALLNFSDFAKEITNKVFSDTSFFYLNPDKKAGKSAKEQTSFLNAVNADLLRQTGIIRKDGQLGDATKAGLIFAAYQAIQDLDSATLLDRRDVGRILGKSKEQSEAMPTELYNHFANAGVSRLAAYNNWGGYVANAVGIKSKDTDTAADSEMAKIKTALGGQVYQLLTYNVPLTYLKNGVPTKSPRGHVGFSEAFHTKGLLRIALEGMNIEDFPTKESQEDFDVITYRITKERAEYANKAAEANKGTSGLVAGLFDTVRDAPMPSNKPITKVAETTSTGMGITTEQAESIKAKQAVNWTLNPFKAGYLINATKEQLNSLLGLKTEEEINSTVQASLRKGTIAAQNALLKETEALKDYVNADPDAAYSNGFYLLDDIWKMLRVGIKSSINPTNSKIIRSVITHESWNRPIDLNDPTQKTNFLLRVAEGFSIATDKNDTRTALDALAKVEKDSRFTKAIEYLNRPEVWDSGNPENGAAYIALTEAMDMGGLSGGERTKTLASLVEYAKYQKASDNKETSFNTDLLVEVDGVTNGPILTLLFMGITALGKLMPAFFEKGGFYQDTFQSYNVWRSQKEAQDLYESVAVESNTAVLKAVGEERNNERIKANAAIFYFTGKVENSIQKYVTRARIKSGTNPIVFGSSPTTSVKAMYRDMLDSVLDKIAEVKIEHDEASNETAYGLAASNLAILKRHMASLGITEVRIEKDGVITPKPLAQATALDLFNHFQFSAYQENNIWNNYYYYSKKGSKYRFNGVGNAIASGIATSFGSFLEERSKITGVSNQSAKFYLARKEELILAKFPEYNKGTNFIGLTHQEEAEIENQLMEEGFTPIIHSYYSQRSGKLSEGLKMVKTGVGEGYTTPAYRTQLTGSQAFVGGTSLSALHTSAIARHTIEQVPGVLNTSVPTHSSDAYTAIQAIYELIQEGINSVNIHDAVGTSLHDGVKMAKKLNQKVFEVLVNYSPMSVTADMGLRTYKAAAQNGSDLTAVNKKGETVYLVDGLRDLVTQAAISTQNKLNYLKTVKHVNQYALEGGAYEVTTADIAAIDAALEANKQWLAKATVELTAIQELVNKNKPSEVASDTIPTQVVEDGAPTDEAYPDQEPTSEADVTPTTPVVKEFESFTDILGRLFKNSTDEASVNLVNVLLRVMPRNAQAIKVASVSEIPNDGVKQAAEKFFETAEFANTPGITVTVDGVPYVIVFQKGNNKEVLLHEAVHTIISSYLVQKEFDADAQLTIDNLNAIKDLAFKNFPEDTGLDKEAVFSSLDEFVAAALTNNKLRQALSTMRVDDAIVQTAYRGKTNLFNKLIKSLSKLYEFAIGKFTKTGQIDKRSKKALNNALVAFLAESSNLFEQASNTTTTGTTVNAITTSPNGKFTYTTEDLYNFLEDPQNPPDKATDDYLKAALAAISNAVYGPYGTFKEALMKDTLTKEADILSLAEAADISPIARDMKASLNMTLQETFVADQIGMTVEEALSSQKHNHFKRTLEKMYEQVVKQKLVTVDMLLDAPNPTAHELQEAQDLHEFLFNPEKTNGHTLARFVALGLINKKLMKVFSQVKTNLADPSPKNSLFKFLKHWIGAVLNVFNRLSLGAYNGQPMDQSLRNITRRLVKHEKVRQAALATPAEAGLVTQLFNKGSKKLQEKAVKALESKRNPFPNATLPLKWLAKDEVGVVGEGYLKTRMAIFPSKLGIIAGVVNEVLTETDYKKPYNRVLQKVKQIETEREKKAQTVVGLIEDSFLKPLKKEFREAMSMLLRTGVSTTDYTANDVSTFINDNNALKAEITAIKDAITAITPKYSKLLAYRSEALGNQLMTGHNRGVISGVTNAQTIVNMTGLPDQGKLSAEMNQLVPLVEKLISLEAIKYLPTINRINLVPTFNEELARGTENGIKFTLAEAKVINQKAKETIFKGEEMLMAHGYLPEVTDSKISIIYATASHNRTAEETRDLYLKAGYTLLGKVEKDKSDPTKHTTYQLINRHVPETRKVTGLLSFISNETKGSTLHDGSRTNFSAAYNNKVNAEIAAANARALKQLERNGFVFDPTSRENNLVLVNNADGGMVNARYEASHSMRNALNRNNDFAFLLGKTAGTILEKESTAVSNPEIIKALKATYDKETKLIEKAMYLKVGKDALTKEYREAYAKIPYATRQVINEVWGEDNMYIRKDMLDMVLGYAKPTIGDAMLASKAEQGMLMKLFTQLMTAFYRQGRTPDDLYAARLKAANHMKVFQKVWEEGVREAKDIIVLKTGMVLIQNMLSNLTLLKLNGMSFIDAVRAKARGLEALNVYRDQLNEYEKLQAYIDTDTNPAQHSEYRKRIAFLQESMNTNPVKELIDAGFMPSIIEDVETESSDYSYKSLLVNKVESKLSKAGTLGKGASKAAHLLYMAEDTGLYQFMRYSTQVSDFVARFALNEHLKAENKLSTENRLSKVAESFVLYDVPSHRALEAMNAVGLVTFTKFLLRIQAPLYRAMRDNPLNTFLLLAMNNIFEGLEVITDSHWSNKLYSPIKTGAGEWFKALDDIATLNAIGSLVPDK